MLNYELEVALADVAKHSTSSHLMINAAL